MLFSGALHTFRGSVAPFFMPVKKKSVGLLQTGAAVHPLLALFVPIQKCFSICEKKTIYLNTSPVVSCYLFKIHAELL